MVAFMKKKSDKKLMRFDQFPDSLLHKKKNKNDQTV